jgi:hypothetical protein
METLHLQGELQFSLPLNYNSLTYPFRSSFSTLPPDSSVQPDFYFNLPALMCFDRSSTSSLAPTSSARKTPNPQINYHVIIGTVIGVVDFSVLILGIAILLIRRRYLIRSTPSEAEIIPFSWPEQKIFEYEPSNASLENHESLLIQRVMELGYPEREASMVRMLARQELNERFAELQASDSRVQVAVVEIVASVLSRLDLASDGVPPPYASNEDS